MCTYREAGSLSKAPFWHWAYSGEHSFLPSYVYWRRQIYPKLYLTHRIQYYLRWRCRLEEK